MGRAKLKLKPIDDARVQSTTYKKRAANVLKKAEELAVLCGVETCVISTGPPVFGQPREVITWPENNPAVIKSLIDKYTSLPQTSKANQKRNMKLSDILNVRKKKAEIVLTKMQKGNSDSKYPSWDERFNRMPEERLLEFAGHLELKLKGIRAKIEMLKTEKRIKNGFDQKKLIEFLPPQFPPGFNLNDSFARSDQGHRIDQNQTMMRNMNDNIYTQISGGASSSNMIYIPQQHLFYYDPTIIMSPSPFCYYTPAPHPIGPDLQLQMNSGASSQFHGFQMKEYDQGCEKSETRE